MIDLAIKKIDCDKCHYPNKAWVEKLDFEVIWIVLLYSVLILYE